MNLNKKKNIILEEIATYNPEFLRQAKFKIDKSVAPEKLDYLELVCDVLFSIINKLDTNEQIDKYWAIHKEGTLFNYLIKAIDTNAKRKNAPFLRKKLKIKNRYIHNEEIKYKHTLYPEPEPVSDQAQFILECLETPKAPLLFGEHWKYYTQLFKEYINNPSTTYQSLADKYNIPKPTISLHIQDLKKILRKEYYENFTQTD